VETGIWRLRHGGRRSYIMRRTKGFTLIELLVVIAIIALLVSILMPSLGRARELAKQAACQANLNSAGKAIAVYQTSQDDLFPLLSNSGNPNTDTMQSDNNTTLWDTNTGVCYLSKVGNAEVFHMQNVWLLIKDGMVSTGTFKCPSDGDWTKRQTADRHGWVEYTEFSYGIHYPYADDGTATNPYALSNMNLDGGFPIMADRMPVDSGPANSVVKAFTVPPSNHFKDGEAFLTKGFSVSMYKSTEDSQAGLNSDDIYRAQPNFTGPLGGLPVINPAPPAPAIPDTSIGVSGRAFP